MLSSKGAAYYYFAKKHSSTYKVIPCSAQRQHGTTKEALISL